MRKTRLSSLSDSGTEEIQINVTPLIDVVFVVLIMFILIAPLMELDRIQLATAGTSPLKESSVTEEKDAIAIYVNADNTIWMHNRLLDEKQLIALLKAAKHSHPQKIPRLFHDKKAHFGTYQNVKNAVETAGFEQLDIILQP